MCSAPYLLDAQPLSRHSSAASWSPHHFDMTTHESTFVHVCPCQSTTPLDTVCQTASEVNANSSQLLLGCLLSCSSFPYFCVIKFIHNVQSSSPDSLSLSPHTLYYSLLDFSPRLYLQVTPPAAALKSISVTPSVPWSLTVSTQAWSCSCRRAGVVVRCVP